MTQQVRYIARGASDRTDEWAFWFVADRNKGGLNVTAELIREHFNPNHAGGVFVLQDCANQIAAKANEATL